MSLLSDPHNAPEPEPTRPIRRPFGPVAGPGSKDLRFRSSERCQVQDVVAGQAPDFAITVPHSPARAQPGRSPRVPCSPHQHEGFPPLVNLGFRFLRIGPRWICVQVL